jgi:hypothetical protein
MGRKKPQLGCAPIKLRLETDMATARDGAGNIWEVDANGRPIRLVQQAQAPTSGQAAPSDPTKRRAGELGNDHTQAQIAATLAGIQAQQQQIALDRQRLIASMAEKGLNPDGTPIPGWHPQTATPVGGRPAPTAAEFGKALAQYSAAGQLDTLMADIAAKYQAGPGATHGFAGILDYLPGQANQRFDTAANGGRGIVRNALGLTGGEANTAAEANMNLGAYIPSSSQFDGTIEDSITRLGELRNKARSQAIQTLGGVPDANGNITPIQTPNAMQQPYAVNQAPQAAGFGATQSTTPIPKEMQDAYNSYISTHLGNIDPQDYVKFRMGLDAQYGFGTDPATWKTYLDEASRLNDQVKKGSTINATIPGPKRDLGLIGGLRNDAVSNPFGAAAAGFADAGSFGGVTALAGDKMDALRNSSTANSLAMLGGEMVGSVGATSLLRRAGEAVSRRLAPSLLRPGPIPNLARNLLTDTTYGATYGGVANGDPVTGAVAGSAGSVLGQGASHALGAAVGGVPVSDAVARLRALGVPLTLGRTLGGIPARIEDGMASLPGAGDMVQARQMDMLRGFNRAGFDAGGAPINANVGTTGRQGITDLNVAKEQAYRSALDPVAIDPSQGQFLQDIAGVRQNAARIPNVNGAQDAALAGLDSRLAGAIDPNTGMIPGRNFQEAYRGLARTGRERAAGDYGHEVGQVMGQGQDALATALEAQNPGAYGAFLRANAANRNLNTLSDAVNSAQNQTDQLFTAAQLNAASRASGKRFGSKVTAAIGDNPLTDLADIGQGVIPSKLPDSGTARRLIQASLLAGLTGAGAGAGYASNQDDPLGGAGSGAMKSLAALALLSLGGTRAGQRALTNAFVVRPQPMAELGGAISRRAGLFGSAAAPLAIQGSR